MPGSRRGHQGLIIGVALDDDSCPKLAVIQPSAIPIIEGEFTLPNLLPVIYSSGFIRVILEHT